MHFSKVIFAAALPAAMAAPTGVKSMMADVNEWTIQNMVRTCDAGNDSCKWSFVINTNTDPETPTACGFTVLGSPATEAPVNGMTCGAFTVSAGWSGQFGPGNGFTTLSVVLESQKLIVWPAYTDAQLTNGTIVTPDQSYAPTTLA